MNRNQLNCKAPCWGTSLQHCFTPALCVRGQLRLYQAFCLHAMGGGCHPFVQPLCACSHRTLGADDLPVELWERIIWHAVAVDENGEELEIDQLGLLIKVWPR